MWEFANGNDTSFDPCSEEKDIKSIGNTITPPRDICNDDECAAMLYFLSKSVAKRLKRHSFSAHCVAIVVKRSDFSTITRQKTFHCPIDSPENIFIHAFSLFRENHDWKLNVRSIGVKAERLTNGAYEQMTFLDDSPDFPLLIMTRLCSNEK